MVETCFNYLLVVTRMTIPKNCILLYVLLKMTTIWGFVRLEASRVPALIRFWYSCICLMLGTSSIQIFPKKRWWVSSEKCRTIRKKSPAKTNPNLLNEVNQFIRLCFGDWATKPIGRTCEASGLWKLGWHQKSTVKQVVSYRMHVR